MANKPGRRGVEHAAQEEAAARLDGDDLLLVIGRPPPGQWGELGSLQLDPFAIVRVAPANDLVDETAVAVEVVEVSAATQKKGVFQRLLEMAVRTLDRSVLVRDTRVVARRPHVVMAHEPLVAPRQILLGVAVEVAERGRQAVAAMLVRYAAEPPQRILQSLGQGDEALAAEHDVGMLEARERQPEVVEPMVERNAGNRDAEPARVGEVGQAEAAGLVLLAEDDILLRASQRPPSPHAPFESAPDAGADLGMAPPDLFEHGDRADAGRRLQDRHDRAIPDGDERVRAPPAPWRLLLGGQARLILDPIPSRGAEAGFGGSDGRGVCLSETHVQPHLVVVDVEAGQALIPRRLRRIRSLTPSCSTARRVRKRTAGGGLPSVGLRPPSVSPPPAQSHPD